MPMILLVVLVTLSIARGGIGAERYAVEQDAAIASFLSERTAWHPMCLYTFDDPEIGSSSTVANQVPGGACPFDALQPDNELVTSLNAASSFWQLGVHLAEDPSNDTKRVQLSSISSVSAREFFTMAAVRNDSVSGSGVTFEMVIRRRASTNRSMTLFSIANEYDNCVDPGFRLDLNEHQVLAFVYFVPVLEEGGEAGVEACYEQRLFSVDTSAACQLPPLVEPVERTPVVQITVTLDPSSERGLWKTDFYMSYTDVDTMQRIDCVVHDEQHPPNPQVLNKLIEGRYRLYLGNSPRNVTSPRKRKRLGPAREFQSLGNASSLNATERLRVVLKHKLMSISGPRLPKAMRIFGDNSLSLHLLGVTFPPLNEDTPLAYLRSKIEDFKEQYGDQIVDYLVHLVQQKASKSVIGRSYEQSRQGGDFPTSPGQSSDGSEAFSRANLYQGAGGATFDLFHFAIYRRVVSEEQVNSVTRQRLLPSRQFPSKQQTVRIPEDSLVLLNLSMLHGVFDDLCLELRGLPEFGQLLLFPNQTVVSADNTDAFQELPLEYQRCIFFRPEPDQNNENLPLPNPVAFSRRLQPYATVTFGVAESLAGRIVNQSTEARIDIFVDAVNDPPRPRNSELEITVRLGVPVTLDLEGDDDDGTPPASASNGKTSDVSELLSSFTFTNVTTTSTSHQLSKIVRMPKFGKLFDCNTSCKTMSYAQDLELEYARVYRNSTDIDTATHSTTLLYIYYGWGQENVEQNGGGLVVDELWYILSDGDPGVFSDVGIIKFALASGTIKTVGGNALTTIHLDEDSLQLLNLGMLDPLAPFFNSRTRYELTVLPRHGNLFQLNDFNNSAAAEENTANATKNVSREQIGARIRTTGTIVSDLQGRVIYVPKLNYFNLDPRLPFAWDSDVDYFEYKVLNTPTSNNSLVVHERSPAALFNNGSVARRVRLEVVNVPDDLVVLPPPFAFTSSGDTAPAPVAFEDPDSINTDQLYQVNLEAADGISELELGVVVTDEDVMAGCPYERPCVLLWSTNGTRLNASSNSTRDSELSFHVTTQLYDPSHIQVTGTIAALSKALSALVFRDLSGISPNVAHTAELKMWVKRIGTGAESEATTQETTGTFTITFPSGASSESTSGGNLVLDLSSQLERYISTLVFLLAGWLVLSNASCISFGFCCCCCSRARKKRRQKFEQEQRLFRKQVAQNDYEYSVLLMSLADMVLQPDLGVSVCLLGSCVSSTGSVKEEEILMQAFILRSLLPLLESERQGTRFVFKLMAIEYSEGLPSMKGNRSIFQRQGFLTQHSAASMALACFCRVVGGKWMAELLSPSGDTRKVYPVDPILELDALLDKLTEHIEALPVEIVILCRVCAKLFREGGTNHSRERELDAVHLVFFNHFLGPALLFPRECVPGFHPSVKQEKVMRAMAFRIAEFTDQWRACGKIDDFRSRSCSTDSLLGPFSAEIELLTACQRKYEEVMETISWSSTVASAYDPSELKADVDCELMGMCLMNIHSLLDSYFPEFKRRLQTQTSSNSEQTEATITRTTRLLKALSYPLASIDELVEYARPELLKDPLLWNDFSFHEWQHRAEIQHHRHPTTNTKCTATGGEKPRSLLAEQFDDDSDFILEEQGTSPLDVDWLNT